MTLLRIRVVDEPGYPVMQPLWFNSLEVLNAYPCRSYRQGVDAAVDLEKDAAVPSRTHPAAVIGGLQRPLSSQLRAQLDECGVWVALSSGNL